jgi:hypothetical protein
MNVLTLGLAELARVLIRLNHVANFIIKGTNRCLEPSPLDANEQTPGVIQKGEVTTLLDPLIDSQESMSLLKRCLK